MKICAVSDLHGFFPVLKSGDLLIVAGDCTTVDRPKDWLKFFEWFAYQDYRKKILVAGNHDNYLITVIPGDFGGFEYLEDTGTEFEGYKIWGSPWTLDFKECNLHCKAFTGTEKELKTHFDNIPTDTDILVTHSPPLGCLDLNAVNIPCGSRSLKDRSLIVQASVHVFGHIHEQGACSHNKEFGSYYNCSIMNERYKPLNPPTYIELRDL